MPRVMSALTAAVLGTAAALFVLPASAANADGSGELESGFLWPADAGTVEWEDPAASGGKLAALRLYDNSEDGDPGKEGPNPKLILHLREGHIEEMVMLKDVPQWAHPIVAAALRRRS